MLHLSCQLLHLLSQAGVFCLKALLNVLLQNLCLALPLISILCILFHSLDLLAILGVALFEVLGSYARAFQRELEVSCLLGYLLDLFSLGSCLLVSFLPLALQLVLYFYCHVGFLFKQDLDLPGYDFVLVLACNELLLHPFEVRSHCCHRLVNIKDLALCFFDS